MKKTAFIIALLLSLGACKKESLTEVLKDDKSPLIDKLSESWNLDYIDSYYTLNIALGDIMVLYSDSKCSVYTPGDAISTTQSWSLNSSLYSVNLPCIQGSGLNGYDWNIDKLEDKQLWLSRSVNDKVLILRFSKK